MKRREQIKVNSNKPLVSVIMPVYNSGRFLVGALDSIINQNYHNWELIAVDDASSDDSFLILKQYAKLDRRIKIYKNRENMGVSKTSNFAISRAKGKFIVRMDSDDIMYSDRLGSQVGFLLDNPNVVVVGGQVKLMDKYGRNLGNKIFPLNHKEIYEMLYTAMPVQQGAMMVNTRLLPKNFDWYNGVRVAEEVKLFFRLIRYGKFANLPNFVLKYRQYPQSTSLRDPKETFRITYKVRKGAKNKFGYVPSLKSKIINIIQVAAVAILPASLVYPVFMGFRKVTLRFDMPKFSVNALVGFFNSKYNSLMAAPERLV